MAKSAGTEAHRDRILKVALVLLTKQGRDAVTTRNVAEAAKVQPPVLYRLFGDKNGLLDAVAAYGFSAYLAKKRPPEEQDDPVEGLRAGWDLHVEFGLANPELYLLMYASPQPGRESPAAQQAHDMLDRHMRSVAGAGRLRVSVERGCALYHAAALGIVMLLLSTALEQRDLELSRTARDYALRSLTTEAPLVGSFTPASVANQMSALLAESAWGGKVFSHAEQSLFSEWLQRLVDLPQPRRSNGVTG